MLLQLWSRMRYWMVLQVGEDAVLCCTPQYTLDVNKAGTKKETSIQISDLVFPYHWSGWFSQ